MINALRLAVEAWRVLPNPNDWAVDPPDLGRNRDPVFLGNRRDHGALMFAGTLVGKVAHASFGPPTARQERGRRLSTATAVIYAE